MREIVLSRVDQKINAGPWELRSQSFPVSHSRVISEHAYEKPRRVLTAFGDVN